MRRWVLVTTAAAAAGWAGGSLPGTLAPDTGQGQPPMFLLLAGAAAIGVVMGTVLGALQALVLRSHVPHPWRWAGASALAWPVTMVVIFLGATTPDDSWSTPGVIALGALTGTIAGALLGAVLGWSAPSLTGTKASGRVSGAWHDRPVTAAPDDNDLAPLGTSMRSRPIAVTIRGQSSPARHPSSGSLRKPQQPWSHHAHPREGQHERP